MTQNNNETYKILVTGGAGYIGSHAVLELLDNNFSVVILDKNLPNAVFGDYIYNLPDEKCRFIHGDLLDLKLLDQIFKEYNFSGIIHFAADPAFVSQNSIYVKNYYTNNVISSINLIDLAREFGVKNFVFSSTAAMYGNPEILPITEDSKLAPINVYGYTKSIVEKMLLDYGEIYQLNSVRLRYFNACGADKLGRSGEAHDPEIHLIPNILKSVGTDKIFKLFGNDFDTIDGTCVRDYIHVNDLASAHVAALKLLIQANESGETITQVINLGTGNGYSNLQIFETARKIVGEDILFEYDKRRAGDPGTLIAENKKAHLILGWRPVHSSLENIIQTAWDWENSYYRNIKK